MYRLTIHIRSDDTIHPNTNTLFGALFGTEANMKRIFGTSLVSVHCSEKMSVDGSADKFLQSSSLF